MSCCKLLPLSSWTHLPQFPPPSAPAPTPITATATPDIFASADIRTMSADELAARKAKEDKKKAKKALKKKRSKEAKRLKKTQTDSVTDWSLECIADSHIPTPRKPTALIPPC